MSLEINITGEVGLIEAFAGLVNSKEENGIIRIPEQYGRGYLRGFNLDPGLRMMIRDYELNKDLVVKRTVATNSPDRLVISFHNVFTSRKDAELQTNKQFNKKQLPSIQVVSGNMDSEMFFPSTSKFNAIIIAVNVDYLKKLLNNHLDKSILKTIVSNNQSYLFEELMSPAIQKVASEIVEVEIPLELQNFYFRVKTEELICLMITELIKRESAKVQSLNVLDVQKIYQIRDIIISKLDTPPILMELSKLAGMSESKLKRLFKQIFGNSIFNYYQNLRMKEAAFLIKENKMSVSEVGYSMGFSNLSHFTKVFEEHIGMKPKRYSVSK